MKNAIKCTIILLIIVFEINNLEAQSLSVQTGHSAAINDMELSPDGIYLATVSNDNNLVLWDMIASKQLNVFNGHFDKVNDVSFHPIKKILATASDDKTVKIWTYPNGKLIKEYKFNLKVKAINYSPDGKYLACASDSIYLINTYNNQTEKLNKKAKHLFTTVKFSKNGKYLAIGGKRYRKVYIYNFEKRKIIKRYRTHSNNLIFSKNNKYVYSAGNLGNVKRFMTSSLSLRKKINFTANKIWHAYHDVAINDKYLVAANRNNMIYVYSLNSSKLKFILKGHLNEVTALQFTKNGKFLLSAGKDRKILIWDLENRVITKILYGGGKEISTFSFSVDGKKMFIGYKDGTLKLWNLENKGEIISTKIPLSRSKIRNRWEYEVVECSNHFNNKILIKAYLKQKDKSTQRYYKTKENLIIWDLSKYDKFKKKKSLSIKKIRKKRDYKSFNILDSTIISFFYKSTHSQEKSILNKSFEKPVEKVFSTKYIQYKQLDKTKLKKRKFLALNKIKGDLITKTVSKDGKYIACVFYRVFKDNYCEIRQVSKNKLIHSFTIDKTINYAKISPLNRFLCLYSSEQKKIYQYDLNTAKLIKNYNGNIPIGFDDEDEIMIFNNINNKLHAINTKNNLDLFKVSASHTSTISDIKFNKKYNYFATAGHDGLIKFWDIKTGDLLVNAASFNESDFIYITPQNHYYSSRGAMDFIGFRVKNTVYSFEQFDLNYNRPDIVLSKLQYTAPEIIESYHKAYLKRVAKSGFTIEQISSDFHIPKSELLNSEEIPISTKKESITIKINANDSLYTIDRFNVWVNDVPVFGAKGYSVKDKQKKNIEKVFEIKLSQGINNIQFSCINEKGSESLRKSVHVKYDTEEKKPDLYIIAIGVSEYKNPDYNLSFAAKDAQDLSKMFKKHRRDFGKIHRINILNKKATRENILKINKQLQKTNIDDIVILFFAGHGILDYDMNYYLTTTETDLYDMENTCILYNEFESILDNIPARKRLILIDACHSGEVDTEDELVVIKKKKGDNNARNISKDKEIDESENYEMVSTFDLMKELFADIRRGTGSIVISAAGGDEYALEGKKWENGIFTYCMMEGLKSKKADLNKDGDIMTSELKEYISKRVTDLTKGRQNPTSRKENLKSDFKIW